MRSGCIRLACRVAGLLLAALPTAAGAAPVSVAVAANFTAPAQAIATAFTAATGEAVSISPGATGQLYAQITQGAPFEVLLSADAATVSRAVDAGFAVTGTAFTYAVGRLVLFSTDPGLVTGPATLREARFERLAIANPLTAPYGAAAIEVMQRLGVAAALRPRLVTGQSIAQAYQFVDSGNAELGFVALSQVIDRRDGSRWVVPPEDHAPIRQDAVLLAPGRDSAPAKAFLDFLKGGEATGIIARFGYDVPGR